MHPEHTWSKSLYKTFERVARDKRMQRIVQSKGYRMLRSFLASTTAMTVLSVGVSISISLIVGNPSVAFNAVLGLIVGTVVSFGGVYIRNRLEQLEKNVSCSSAERQQEVERTLHLLEHAGERAHTEVFHNALKDTMTHLKDPSTSYALWTEVSAHLRNIQTERERWDASNRQQNKIDVAVEQLNNKINHPPVKDRVIKL